MRLNAAMLENVYNVNSFKIVSEAELSDSGPNYIYIMLIDKSKNDTRYLTQASSYLVTGIFSDIDTAQQFEIIATQPFADDKSIWKISFASIQIPNSGDFILKLTEDGVDRKFKVVQGITVSILNDGGC